MSRFTKYKLYQKYETRGSQEAIPCYPNVFSIDGDGTMPLVIVEENSRDCGYTGETQPIYRWYTLPIDTYYYCDACQDAQYKWVNLPIAEDWECVGTTKYYKQKKQVSVDGGSTWTDVTPPQYQRGALYEYSSQSCGYRTRTSSGSPYCEGYDKYVDVYYQVSSDGGNTWQTTATTNVLVEAHSSDCGGDYSNQYLTFVARESGTFKLSGNSVAYSLDSGQTWNTLANNTNSPTVQSGHKIMWKGNLIPNSSIGIGSFSSSGEFDVEGNAMSLLYGDNFENVTSLNNKDYAYHYLFNNCTKLKSVNNLKLVATSLSVGCYKYMFKDCTSLTSLPQLPSTVMVDNCYTAMFEGCTSITAVPSNYLPSTSLADACYDHMFYGCTSLTSLPQLPASIMVDNCYLGMFMSCISLTTIPTNYLPSTTLASFCYHNMFYGCSSLSSVPSNLLSATTLAFSCYHGMFAYCSSLTAAPELLAATLTNNCYDSMFYGCTSLNYIKCTATHISALGSTRYWLYNVSSSGTFVKSSSMSGWSSGDDGIPNNWSVQNA